MNTQQTVEQLKQLKLKGMTQAYQSLASLPVHEQFTSSRHSTFNAGRITTSKSSENTNVFKLK